MMSIQLADVQHIEPVATQALPMPGVPVPSLPGVPVPGLRVMDDHVDEDERRMSAARGIVTAMALSAPFWAIVGFALLLIW